MTPPPLRQELASFLLPNLLMTATISEFMTRSVHTIGHHQPLAAAHRIMQKHAIRHLPVLDGGKLVGVLSERDLHVIEALNEIDPEELKVSEAMTAEAFAISPSTSLKEVATEMARQKYGCAVVVERAQVVGVFTTIDALEALVGLLD